MSLIFNAKTQNLGDLLGNGNIFTVPDFQRDYAWCEDNWQDLWNDSIRVWEEKQEHFMGSLMLQENEEGSEKFIILDGQQRTVTLSIFIIAITNILTKYGFGDIAQEIKTTYIGKKNIEKNLTFEIKLTLNDKDKHFYYNHLATNIKAPMSIKSLPKSQQRMWKCYEFFCDRIEEYFVENSVLNDKDLLNFLVSGLRQKLLFIRIDVGDAQSAFTLFETLNGTGLKLSPADMIKSYLFSITSKVADTFESVKTSWKNIIDNVEEEEFSDFMRYVWNATEKKITKSELFKEVKKTVKNTQDVISVVTKLENFSQIYMALSDCDSNFWEQDQKEKIYILSNLLKNKQYKILLMVCYLKLSKSDFDKILKDMVAFVFRFQEISGISPNKLEPLYSKIAIDLYKGNITKYSQVKSILLENYVKDTQFVANFEVWEPSNTKIARYTLVCIENYLTEGNRSSIYENETIEHILPQNPSDIWLESYKNLIKVEKNTYKLGNLTLLEKNLNKKLENNSFETKKQEYLKSNYTITKDITISDQWLPKDIDTRQQNFAKIAKFLWKIQD